MTFYNHLIEQAPAMVVAIPLLFAFATPLLFKLSAKFGKFWALLGVLATTVLMYVLAWDVLSEGGDVVNTYIFGAENTQLPLLGDNAVRISFAVDGMSAFMGLIMVTVSLAAVIYSLAFVKKYTPTSARFEGGCLGFSTSRRTLPFPSTLAMPNAVGLSTGLSRICAAASLAWKS